LHPWTLSAGCAWESRNSATIVLLFSRGEPWAATSPPPRAPRKSKNVGVAPFRPQNQFEIGVATYEDVCLADVRCRQQTNHQSPLPFRSGFFLQSQHPPHLLPERKKHREQQSAQHTHFLVLRTSADAR